MAVTSPLMTLFRFLPGYGTVRSRPALTVMDTRRQSTSRLRGGSVPSGLDMTWLTDHHWGVSRTSRASRWPKGRIGNKVGVAPSQRPGPSWPKKAK